MSGVAGQRNRIGWLRLIPNTDPHWIGCPVGILYNSDLMLKNLLQDRVFLRPKVSGRNVRDYACVIRQGRAGTRRIGHGVERLQIDQDGIRAYRFRSRTGDVIAVANFTTVSESVELAGKSVQVPAMDTVLIEN